MAIFNQVQLHEPYIQGGFGTNFKVGRTNLEVENKLKVGTQLKVGTMLEV